MCEKERKKKRKSKSKRNKVTKSENLSILDNNIYHGRKAERLFLNEIFEESIRQNTIYVTISGQAGSGKSALVRSQNWDGKDSRCIFASGKFEPKESSIPFSAFSDTLDQLCSKWTSTEAGRTEIELFCQSLSQDDPLPNLVPNLSRNTGDVKNGYKALSSSSNKIKSFDRLKTNIRDMFKFVIKSSRPVVIQLDDIHWADRESLRLVQYLIKRNLKGLLLLATYRSEMTQQSDILKEHLQEIQQCKTAKERIKHIHLSDLSLADVNGFLSELTSRRSLESLIPVSKAVHEKTGGNPFFIKQFLQLLQSEGLLTFSSRRNKWKWADIDEIRKAMSIISSDVVDVVASSMRRMEPKILEILQVASCIGHQIPLKILRKYFKLEKRRKNSTNYPDLKLVLDQQIKNSILTQKGDSSFYYWSHDKLQQAAYSMISEKESQRVCVKLGKLLLKMSSKASTLKQNTLMYMAADQLNRVPIDLLMNEGKSMKVDLVSLNLQAAKVSISKSAFYNAVELLRSGANILKLISSVWDDHYDTSLELFNNLLETEYTIGNHEEARIAVSEVLYNALTLEDAFRAQVCLASIAANGKDRDASRATEMYIGFLKEYGVFLPKKPSRTHVMVEERILRKALPSGKVEDILKMPPMTNRRAICISSLLTKLTFHASLLPNNENVTKLAAMRTLRLCCIHGVNVNNAVVSICKWGLAEIQGKARNSNEKGFELADIAGNIMRDSKELIIGDYAKIVVTIYAGILPMKKPLEDSLGPLMNCYRIGIKSGEIEHALCAAMVYGYHCLFIGLSSDAIASDMVAFGKEAGFFGLPSIHIQFSIMHKVTLGLKDEKEALSILAGETFEHIDLLNELEGPSRAMTDRDIWTFRLMLAFVYRDVKTSELMLDSLSNISTSGPMIARNHLRQAYTGLSAFMLQRKTGKKHYHKYAYGALKYFNEFVKKGSLNAYPIYCFLVAEKFPSRKNYDGAIDILSRSGMINFEAMANESAALFFFDQKDENSGKIYMSRAMSLYQDWGATAKSFHLRQKYDMPKASRRSSRMNSINFEGSERKSGRMSIFSFKQNHFELMHLLGQHC